MFTSGLSHTDFEDLVVKDLWFDAPLPLDNVIHDSGTLHKYFSSPGQPAFTAHIGTPFSSFGSSVVVGATVVVGASVVVGADVVVGEVGVEGQIGVQYIVLVD